jgi:anti-anti-sigma factor
VSVGTLAISPEGPRGLRLAGELDLRSLRRLTAAFAALPARGQATLDLSELTFIDSSGLHAIEEIARAQNGNGPLILTGTPATVARLLEITNLARHPGLDIREGVRG